MSLKSNIIRGRSHFIFIAALLAGAAFILWAEARDPSNPNARHDAMAGAGPRIVAEFSDAASAKQACAALGSRASKCEIIAP